MILQAQTVSSLIEKELSSARASGSVHSVFAGTVNILCGRRTWLCVHAAGTPLHPYAVVVEPERGRVAQGGPAFLGASGGEVVNIAGEEIALGGGRVVIRIAGAEIWDAKPGRPDGGRPGDPAALLAMIRESSAGHEPASPFLKAAGSSGEAESALIDKCRRIRAGLAESWGRGDVRKSALVMRSAVGLGSGLTPSGDDFLAGFLGAAHMFAYGSAAAGEACSRLRIETSATTLISYFMLRGALRGLLPEPLSSLLRAMAGGDGWQVRESVVRLLGLGSTSGQDMLAGVICYMEAARTAGETG